jgi:O-antigen/teichoic acid export membrane protein
VSRRFDPISSDKLSNLFVRNNVFVLAGSLVVYAKGIILLPVLVRTVGVEVYGHYVVLATLLGLIFGISTFGVGFRAKRYLPSAVAAPEAHGLFTGQFQFHAFSTILLSLLMWVLWDSINGIFFSNAAPNAALSSVGFMVSSLIFSQAADYVRYTHRLSWFTFATVCNPYLHIAIVIGLVAWQGTISLEQLIWANAISMGLVSVPLIVKLLREIGAPVTRVSWGFLKEDFRLGLPLLISYLLDFILSSADRLLIAHFLGPLYVGYYAPAYTLATTILVIPKGLGVAVPPVLSAAVDRGGKAAATHLLNRAVRLYLAAAIPFVAGAVVLGYPLLRLLAKSEVADASSGVVPIVALAMVFAGLTIILAFGAAYISLDTRVTLKAASIAALSSLGLNILVLTVWPKLVLVALVCLFSSFLSCAFVWVRTRHSLELRIDPAYLTKVIIASGAMMGALWSFMALVHLPALLGLGIAVVGGIALYAFIASLLGLFSRHDLATLVEQLSNK